MEKQDFFLSDKKIRCVVDDQGELWAVGRDIYQAVEPKQAASNWRWRILRVKPKAKFLTRKDLPEKVFLDLAEGTQAGRISLIHHADIDLLVREGNPMLDRLRDLKADLARLSGRKKDTPAQAKATVKICEPDGHGGSTSAREIREIVERAKLAPEVMEAAGDLIEALGLNPEKGIMLKDRACRKLLGFSPLELLGINGTTELYK